MLAHAGHRGAALNFTKEVEGKKVETQIEVVEDILTMFTEEQRRHFSFPLLTGASAPMPIEVDDISSFHITRKA